MAFLWATYAEPGEASMSNYRQESLMQETLGFLDARYSDIQSDMSAALCHSLLKPYCCGIKGDIQNLHTPLKKMVLQGFFSKRNGSICNHEFHI